MSNTAGIEFIRNEMDWDKYDVWGSLQSARFDLAEAWYLASGERLWEYHRSDLLSIGEFESERAERLYGAMKDEVILCGDVSYWEDVLTRMRELVIQAGRDY